ncbi:pentatricopeptide repeat-containing protein At2g35030, mitochondrial [Cryptomeria japonica]|uniref:pentatricopeptide repeat-containing protein At2g35030, mitochondrial n=1 Tax=Cryptomeria japonica TaxID=3369 RepID=UPI0027DAA742|nr:pentatricopeptide repeat-containing protein At2g35030, mitochondrial [Cryptomeria japonica]
MLQLIRLVGFIFHMQRKLFTSQEISFLCYDNATVVCNTISSSYIHLLRGNIQEKCLAEGKLNHAHINERVFATDKVLGNMLINMYAKCGNLVDSRKVFEKMSERDVCSWTVIIAAHVKQGFSEEALILFHQMQLTDFQPNHFTFSTVISACANLLCLEWGVGIHEHTVRSGFQFHVSVANALVDMYAKFGRIEDARQVFDKIFQPDVVSWTAMVAGYAQNGYAEKALELFLQMPRRNVVSWNAIISGLAENGFVGKALELFEEMPDKNVVSWTAMIAGFIRNGYNEEALKLYREMLSAGIRPDSKTFATVIPACANSGDLGMGMEFHEKIITSELHFDPVVANALIVMYAKCLSIQKARKLFDKMRNRDVVSWTAMIAGYAQNGFIDMALKLFEEMPQRNVVSWNAMIAGLAKNGLVNEAWKLFKEMPERTAVSWNAMISGYVQNGLVDEAMELFKKMPQQTMLSWNTMITGFAQTGLVNEALNLFKEMPQWNVVSWNAMIAGFAQNGHGEEALNLFQDMQSAELNPDSMTFSCILSVCANFAALRQGMEIHEKIVRNGFQCDVTVVNALIDMYAKCGSIQKAWELFDKMHQRNVISWTAMIGGYAMHGRTRESLKLFEEMKQSGINPDHITFVSVLSACSHAGLVEEGYQYFSHMSKHYDIRPTMDHYNCMVDLFGRAGNLEKAQDFINKMPIKPDASVWSCLLGACRVHNNIELAEHAAQHLFLLDPRNDAPYVLLSNVYAAAGMWNDIEIIRNMMKHRGIKKSPGCSWIEVNKHVHAFLTGNTSDQQM